jgi:predicted TIM-barrel fold metal-dependent hydrolase
MSTSAPGLIDWPARVQITNDCGVDVHVLSNTIPRPGVQLDDVQSGSAMAKDLNDEAANPIAAYRGRFAGLAAVPASVCTSHVPFPAEYLKKNP